MFLKSLGYVKMEPHSDLHCWQILSDTKNLQKEINSLTGKLDRTFAVTDEMVFKVQQGSLNCTI